MKSAAELLQGALDLDNDTQPKERRDHKFPIYFDIRNQPDPDPDLDLGHFSNIFGQLTLPYRKPKSLTFVRTNGIYEFTIDAVERYGMPYGSYPRLVLAYICSEVVRTKSREIWLGKDAKEFCMTLLKRYNGRDLAKVKEQTRALLGCRFSLRYVDKKGAKNGARPDVPWKQMMIANAGVDSFDTDDADLRLPWTKKLIVSYEFYEGIIGHAFPFDFRALQVLRQSPVALDLYLWLIYRNFCLTAMKQKEVQIPWSGLAAQFGTTSSGEASLRDFRSKVKEKLKLVLDLLNVGHGDMGIRVETTSEHFILIRGALPMRAK